MVTISERDYLWQTYATDRRAGSISASAAGWRRSWSATPPHRADEQPVVLHAGAPVIYYGDELAWATTSGWATATACAHHAVVADGKRRLLARRSGGRCALPVIMDALYGYETINAEAQTPTPMVAAALDAPHAGIAAARAFGRAACASSTLNRKVLAYLRELDGEVILCVANVSHTPQAVELDSRIQQPRAG